MLDGFIAYPSWSLFLWEMLSSNKSASIPVSIIWWYLDSFYSLVQGEKCCSDLTNHSIPLFWPQRLVQGGEYDPVRPKKVVTRLLMGAPTREAFSFFFRYKLNVELLGYSLKQLDGHFTSAMSGTTENETNTQQNRVKRRRKTYSADIIRTPWSIWASNS